MIEQDIQLRANGHLLAGTLSLPAERGKFPVVLMVHGSGPLDRHQNTKGQKLEIFSAFAHHLAQEGIACVRFDKRGCGSSEGDYYTTGHHDLVDDVVCWIDLLQRAEFCQPEQLFLLGHSEGCLVAARASLRRGGIAGLVLLCPFIEPLEEILIRQAQQIEREIVAMKGVGRLVHGLIAGLVGGPVANQRELISKVKMSTKPSVRVWLERVPAKWLRELMSVDACQVFGGTTCPMLLVAGEKDLQCDPKDVDRIAALGRGPVEQRVIADMTHILRCDDQPATLLGSQRLLARPVEAEVLGVVAEWLRSRVASAEALPSASTA
jgi:uncharacterized protein